MAGPLNPLKEASILWMARDLINSVIVSPENYISTETNRRRRAKEEAGAYDAINGLKDILAHAIRLPHSREREELEDWMWDITFMNPPRDRVSKHYMRGFNNIKKDILIKLGTLLAMYNTVR